MRKSDIILFLVLLLSALWRWGPTVATPTPLYDEMAYVHAARHLEAGRSPYAEPIYFYPPPVATFVYKLSPLVGEVGALQMLRGGSLGGLVIVIVLALRAVRWPWFVKHSIGVLFILVAPAARLATALGNVAGLSAGLVIVGLISWKQRPIAAGVALGLGLAIKPIAPLAPLLLAFHRPLEAKRQHWIATVVCAVAALAACIGGLRFLPDLLANAHSATSPYNFSLQKVVIELGFEIPTFLIPLLAGLAALLLVRRQSVGQQDLLIVATVASLVALPILWAHTLLLMLPLQILAIDRCGVAFSRWSTLERLEQAGVMLAAVAIASTLLSHAVGSTLGLPEWFSAAVRVVPLLSIPYLGWFVFGATRDGLLD